MNGIVLKNFKISVLLMIIIAQVPAYIGCATTPVAEIPDAKVVVNTQPVSSEADRIAAEGRKTAVTEANEAAVNLEKAWENLKSTYGNVKNKMKDREMKSDWSAFTKTFPEDLKASKGKIDSDPAGAKANIDELMVIIERWETAFKEITAASLKQKATKAETKPLETLKK